MRRDGIWNAEIVELLVSLRHSDTVVLADAGLPVPSGIRTIDLCWRRGEPRLLPVLDALLDELVVERADVAKEAADGEFVASLLGRLAALSVERIAHDELKAACASATAVIRTGEVTPYANVVLHAGVPFGEGLA